MAIDLGLVLGGLDGGIEGLQGLLTSIKQQGSGDTSSIGLSKQQTDDNAKLVEQINALIAKEKQIDEKNAIAIQQSFSGVSPESIAAGGSVNTGVLSLIPSSIQGIAEVRK